MSGIILEIASTLRRYVRPVRDAEYLRFIRRFPCVACGGSRRVEAAHIGPRGLKQKTSDWTALPLCFKCHQDGPGALHKVGPDSFQASRGLDFAALQAMFNRFFFLRTGHHAAGWEQESERREAA